MKDVPDDWNEPRREVPLGIEVTIPRHTFMSFALRAAEVWAFVDWFKVRHGVANTVIKMRPPSAELIAALKANLEPGETITVGSQSWTLERGKLLPDA